jgi:hypothetical protein
LSLRAAAAASGTLSPKADKRFKPETLAVISRLFAREAALKVGEEGIRWVAGSADSASQLDASLTARLHLDQVRTTQVGLVSDMSALADAIYDRS